MITIKDYLAQVEEQAKLVRGYCPEPIWEPVLVGIDRWVNVCINDIRIYTQRVDEVEPRYNAKDEHELVYIKHTYAGARKAYEAALGRIKVKVQRTLQVRDIVIEAVTAKYVPQLVAMRLVGEHVEDNALFRLEWAVTREMERIFKIMGLLHSLDDSLSISAPFGTIGASILKYEIPGHGRGSQFCFGSINCCRWVNVPDNPSINIGQRENYINDKILFLGNIDLIFSKFCRFARSLDPILVQAGATSILDKLSRLERGEEIKGEENE